MRKFSYNVKDYGWEELIREAFGVDDVSILHQLRADLQAASLKNAEYENKISRMRVDLINKPDYMRSTAIGSGSRSNTRHPKYF